MMRIVCLFVVFFLFISCSSEKSGQVIQVVNVANSGADENSGVSCEKFSLTVDEAQAYFSQSKKVSSEDLKDDSAVSPCFVSGEGALNNEHCAWEIRAGGTGSVSCEGQSFATVCRDCLPPL